MGKGQWETDRVSYYLFRILVEALIAEGFEILAMVDDTLNKHRGKQICGAGWQHGGSAPKHGQEEQTEGLWPKRKAMFEKVTTTIDEDLSTGCGLCVETCPSKTFSMQNGKAAVTGKHSLNCGHCMAICPEGAITVRAIDGSMSRFVSFQADQNWLPYGEFDTAHLVRLMASRRSCRSFLDKPVPQSILDDLVKIGCTAPSATNCQSWTFTVLPTREAVLVLGKTVRNFYVKLNSMAEKSWLRMFMKLIGKPELDRY